MHTPPEGLNSRDRILWAAATMLGEDAGSALSVRAVAARAQVSVGSLRHHFKTQRELMDAVTAIVYDLVLPADAIRDTTIPARDRLVGFLQNLLAPPVMEVTPREGWILAFDRYIRTEPSPEIREESIALEREMRRRVDYALSVLQAEGAVAEGDNDQRATVLLTLISGLSIAQALPAEGSRLQTELTVLNAAADWILTRRPSL